MSIRWFLVGVWFVVTVLRAQVADAQYQVQSWTTDNGLPHNIVSALQQTRDGYIWMASYVGGSRASTATRSGSTTFPIRSRKIPNCHRCMWTAADTPGR